MYFASANPTVGCSRIACRIPSASPKVGEPRAPVRKARGLRHEAKESKIQNRKSKIARPKPVIIERPHESVIIQLHYKQRSSNGRLTEKKSRSVTVQNMTLDEVYERILRALKEE
jgi:hypothetical protein